MKVCETCGEVFDNSFEAIDHFWESEELPDKFEPLINLPGDYSLRLGTLFREIYMAANRKDMQLVKSMVESAYVTLYLSTTEPEYVEEFFYDKEVSKAMNNIDEALKDILDEHKEDGR